MWAVSATVYIYIRSQNEQLIGNRADTARRYTLNLNRANDNRALIDVVVEPDEATLNDRHGLIDDPDEVTRTRIVEGDVAAASEQVSLTITPAEPSAWVSLYELDAFGNFKSESMEFYVPTGVDETGKEIPGTYEYDSSTDTYYLVAEGEVGHYRRIKQVRGSLGSTYVRLSTDDAVDLKGSYTKNASGGYTYVGKGNGPFERYDITVDFPIAHYEYVGADDAGNLLGSYIQNAEGKFVYAGKGKGEYKPVYNETVNYGIQVANLANGADLTPARYTLILNHRDNDLRLSEITANNRRARYVSSDGITLELKDGKLVITGKALEDRKAIADAQRAEQKELIERANCCPIRTSSAVPMTSRPRWSPSVTARA